MDSELTAYANEGHVVQELLGGGFMEIMEKLRSQINRDSPS